MGVDAELVAQGAAAIAREWSARGTARVKAKVYHWHGVAEVAAFEAREALKANASSDAMEWATAAVDIYDELARDDPSDSFVLSVMFVRAEMIRHLGVDASKAAQSLARLVAPVRDVLRASPAEAVEVAAGSRLEMESGANDERFVAGMRQSRKMKSRLGPLKEIDALDCLPADLVPWLAIRARLI